MQPSSEPTSDATAQVQQFLDNQQPAQQPPTPTTQPSNQTPAPEPQPAQQQPLDPFASMFEAAPQPATEPTPTEPASQTPQEPSQPNPQPAIQPVEPATQPTQAATQPTQATQPTPSQSTQASSTSQDDYQTFDEYMNGITKDFGTSPEMPDVEKIDPNDPQAIKTFFDGLVTTAVKRAEQGVARKEAIRTAERNQWEKAFTDYPSLRTNKPLRDMVHNMRMGYFQRGQAITPKQAADKVLELFNGQYKKGVADNKVTTTYEQVQPNAGGGTTVQTTADQQERLTALQTGGEQALIDMLDADIKAGRLQLIAYCFSVVILLQCKLADR